MKKIFINLCTLSVVVLASSSVNAQLNQTKADSAIIGANYANDVYYSFKNSTVKTQPNNDWHLAFRTPAQTDGININSLNTTSKADQQLVSLYNYTKADTSGWASFDTTDWANWQNFENSGNNIEVGAFNTTSTGFPDFSWGVYEPNSHVITGDSLYLIVISNNGVNTFKKIWIENKIDGIWNFRIANVDGTSENKVSINGLDYLNKNFIYYNINTNSIIDREPAKKEWDLLFTRYKELSDDGQGIGNMTYQGFTGVLQNNITKVALISNVADSNANLANVNDSDYSDAYNFISANWKHINASFTGYDMLDSMTYFVKTSSGDIYKLNFTGATLGSSGKNFFNKTLVYEAPASSVNATTNISSFNVFPNPATSYIDIVLDNNITFGKVSAQLADMSGKTILNFNLENNSGLQAKKLDISFLPQGVYYIKINADGEIITKKIVKQ